MLLDLSPIPKQFKVCLWKRIKKLKILFNFRALDQKWISNSLLPGGTHYILVPNEIRTLSSWPPSLSVPDGQLCIWVGKNAILHEPLDLQCNPTQHNSRLWDLYYSFARRITDFYLAGHCKLLQNWIWICPQPIHNEIHRELLFALWTLCRDIMGELKTSFWLNKISKETQNIR